MKFANNRRWWVRAAERRSTSQEGRWLPLLGLGGLIAALVFSAWRFEPMTEKPTAGAAPPTSGPADFRQLPAVRMGLHSDAASRLATISFNGRPVRDANELRAEIRAFLGPATDATVEAELDCDGNLRYEDTQRTIAAISGYPFTDGRTMVPLVDRIKFLPRRSAAMRRRMWIAHALKPTESVTLLFCAFAPLRFSCEISLLRRWSFLTLTLHIANLLLAPLIATAADLASARAVNAWAVRRSGRNLQAASGLRSSSRAGS